MTGAVPGARLRIVLAALVGLVAVPITIWRLTLTGQTMARVFEGAPLASLSGTLVLIAGLVVLRAALQLVRDEIANGTAALVKTWLRTTLYQHVLALGPGYFDQRRTGDTMLSLVEGVEQLDTFFGLYLPQLIVAALTPLIIFAFMAALDVQIGLIFLVFALLTLVVPALFHRLNRRHSLAFRRDQAALGSDFLDAIQGLPLLKAFGQSRQRGLLLAERARQLYRSTMWVLAANTATGGVTLLGISAGAGLALAWGAVRVEQGSLSLSTLLVILLLGVEVFRPLRDLTILYHSSMLGLAATRGIFEVLDAVPTIPNYSGPNSPGPLTLSSSWFDKLTMSAAHPEPVEGPLAATLRFDNVTFAYDGGRRPALSACSFELRAGETLGVVGPSGAGKSTLVNLLLRVVDPQDGRVLVGGRDARDLPLDVVRGQFAVVAQDTYLFYGTVADNLRLGKPDATPAELEQAARLANAHGFISALPHGYDTLVGERGTRLSGGQRQRIAIARALLKDAPILVLDEATSSVDAENEAVIQQALERLQRGRTTLVIAHRLSSVASADRIVVLERGRLVETGGHAQLLARSDGVYARLMAAQHTVEEERAATTRLVMADAAESADGAIPLPEAAVRRQSDAAPLSRARALAESQATVPMAHVWARLLRLVRPWWLETALALLAGLLHAGANVALGVVSALLVGRVVTGADLQPWLTTLVLLVPATALLRWLDSWVSHDLAYRLLAELRISLYRLLDPLAPAYLLRRRSGDLASAIISDVELIELFYAHTISPLFVAVLVPSGVLVTLALFAPTLALVLLPFLVAVALTPLFAGARMERLGAELREAMGDVHAHVVDGIQGLRTIVAFAYGPARLVEVETMSRMLGDLKHRFLRWQAVQNATIEALMGLGGLAVLTVGAGLVTSGQLARVTLPLATLLAMSSFQPIVAIVTVAKELMQTAAAARRFFTVEDEPVPVRDGPGVPASDAPAHDVAFDNVTFRYGPTDQPALRDVSFGVGAGQTVALVGRSGAGKTTLAHLLLRFWDPQSGAISIGGRDLREFGLDDLRRQVALVAQDTYLFNASLRDNLRLARPDASDDAILWAARQANVDEFASTLPDGYDTTVGERGMQLSGGQRQRVAIARALLKDAPILVLDEATSHLDAVNEAEVREALDRLMAGRTTLVIAHRLSTIRNADSIVVLDDGAVVETGRHADLVALDGLYSHLIASQLGRPRTSAPAPANASAGTTYHAS